MYRGYLSYICWRTLVEAAHYSVKKRGKAKTCSDVRTEACAVDCFRIIWGIHSCAMTSRKTNVDEIERCRVNFQSLLGRRGERLLNSYMHFLDLLFCLWK